MAPPKSIPSHSRAGRRKGWRSPKQLLLKRTNSRKSYPCKEGSQVLPPCVPEDNLNSLSLHFLLFKNGPTDGDSYKPRRVVNQEYGKPLCCTLSPRSSPSKVEGKSLTLRPCHKAAANTEKIPHPLRTQSRPPPTTAL